jgi:predicted DNA-binding transcriptional regulator AlpA
MKRILREGEAYARLGIKRSHFRGNFVLNNAADPYLRGTQIPRLKPVPLSTRARGFLESELEALIDALVGLRDQPREPIGRKRKEPAAVPRKPTATAPAQAAE